MAHVSLRERTLRIPEVAWWPQAGTLMYLGSLARCLADCHPIRRQLKCSLSCWRFYLPDGCFSFNWLCKEGERGGWGWGECRFIHQG